MSLEEWFAPVKHQKYSGITDEVWTMQTGEKIKVSEMGDRHLLNTIKFLERRAGAYKQAYANEAWGFYMGLNGEQAQYAMEREIDDIEEADPDELLDVITPHKAMVREATKRGLIPAQPNNPRSSTKGGK